jgi:hypothetical protein
VIIDWWVRLFPRIFANEITATIALASGVIGRHLVLLGGVAAAAAVAGFGFFRRSRL